MQKKYLQILNIHYIQTRGLPGCHNGDAAGWGRFRVTAGAQRSRASNMQWSLLAVGGSIFFLINFFLQGEGGVIQGLKIAYRQQCRTSQKATVIHLEYIHFPIGWSKKKKKKKKTNKKSVQEHLRLTLTKKNITEKDIVYVQMHILYT